MELTRIKNDINGNPRYVVHYLELINQSELNGVDFQGNGPKPGFLYDLAVVKAKKIGGKKFHNKQFGCGIVFQSYNTADLIKSINEIKEL